MKRNGGGRDLGRGSGKGCAAVIGFNVCQEGNSFSLSLLRYPPISPPSVKRPCQDKFVYVVWLGSPAAPPLL